MLETVREYALERLAEGCPRSGTSATGTRAPTPSTPTSRRGLRAATSAPGWIGTHDDRENIRAAIALRRRPRATPTTALRTVRRAGATGRRAATSPRAARSRPRALASGDGPPELRLRTLNAAGVLAGEQGDFAAARELFAECIELAERTGASGRLARASVQPRQPRALRRPLRRGDPALRAARSGSGASAGDVAMLSVVTQNLGLAHSGAGGHDRAIELLDDSVVLARGTGDPAHVASALRSLGRALLLGQRDPRGRSRCSARAWRSRSSSTSARGSLESLETLAGGRRAAHGRGADRRRRGGARGRGRGAPAGRGGVGRQGQGDPARGARRRGVRAGGARGRGPVADRCRRARSVRAADTGIRGLTGTGGGCLVAAAFTGTTTRTASSADAGGTASEPTCRDGGSRSERALVRNPLHMKVLARAESAEEVRAVLRGWLAGTIPDRELGDAELVVTELLTNSVRHAGLAHHDVLRVRATADGEVLHLEVEDDGLKGDAAAPARRPHRRRDRPEHRRRARARLGRAPDRPHHGVGRAALPLGRLAEQPRRSAGGERGAAGAHEDRV